MGQTSLHQQSKKMNRTSTVTMVAMLLATGVHWVAAEEATTCGAGQADHDSDPSTPCVACPAGRFRQAGSPEDLDHGCVACAAGDFAPAGSPRCVPRVGITPAMLRGYGAADQLVQLKQDTNSITSAPGGNAWDIDVADMDGRLAALCSIATSSSCSARLLSWHGTIRIPCTFASTFVIPWTPYRIER